VASTHLNLLKHLLIKDKMLKFTQDPKTIIHRKNNATNLRFELDPNINEFR
jgi:hypothetical protein